MKQISMLFACVVLMGCEPEGGICTKEFVMIAIEILDSSGQPVGLDSTKTVDDMGKIIYSGHDDESPISGYIVLTDSEKPLVSKRGSLLTFKGWKDGAEVVSEAFTIQKWRLPYCSDGRPKPDSAGYLTNYSNFLKNLEGNILNSFLKYLVKYLGLLNPTL